MRTLTFMLVDVDALLCPEEDLEGLEAATHFGASVGWLYLQHGSWPGTTPRPMVQGFGLLDVGDA